MEINIAQVIFQIINFGVVFVALTYLVYKPVLKTLQQRAEKVKASQQAADDVLSEKDAMDKTKTKTVAEAKKQAASLVAAAQKQADDKLADQMAKAKAQVKEFVEAEKEKWEAEKKRMKKEFEKQLSDSVFVVSEKVLSESLDKKALTKSVDASIQEILKAL